MDIIGSNWRGKKLPERVLQNKTYHEAGGHGEKRRRR